MHWRPVNTSLGFQLATWTFWYWRFDALADRRHFTELAPDQALQALSADAARTGNCYLFPAYPVSAPPARLRTEGDWLIYTPKTFPNYFVDVKMPGGFAQYLQGFSSKSRSTLKRKIRRFAEASEGGALEWRAYRSAKEIGEFFEAAADLSARTYQARLLDSGLPTSSEFRSTAIERATTGGMRGFVLFLQQQPAAYVFSTCSNGVASYDYVGHDPALNALSPGTVLQYKILEYLFEDPDVRIFDFTEGEGDHKAFFSTGQRSCAKSIAFPRRPGTLMLSASHLSLNRANQLFDRLLERLAVRAFLRRLIRRKSIFAARNP